MKTHLRISLASSGRLCLSMAGASLYFLIFALPSTQGAAVAVQLKLDQSLEGGEAVLSRDLSFAVAKGATFIGTTTRGAAVLQRTTPTLTELSPSLLREDALVAKATAAESSIIRIHRLVVLFRKTPEGTAAYRAARVGSTFAGLQVVDSVPVSQGIVLDRKMGFGPEELVPLSKDPNIRRIEPDYKYFLPTEVPASVPNDPEYAAHKQWGINNCRADTAWRVITDSSVLVALLDSGIDYTHPDLSENIWSNAAEVPGNGKDDDNNGYVDDVHGYNFASKDAEPLDRHSHGTHCAGIIGARGNNGLGVVGVNWNVKIMAVQIFDENGTAADASVIAKAITYAADAGARVLSNSWGGPDFSKVTKEAIEYARDKGALFIAAAGNDGSDVDASPNYPSGYDVDNIISVGSITSAERPSETSNYGATKVHLFAPGDRIYSTVPGSGYAEKSGTSMATPFVSGAISLMWSHPDYKTKTWKEIKDILLSKGVRLVSALSGKCSTGGTLDLSFLAPSQPPGTGSVSPQGPRSPTPATLDKPQPPARVMVSGKIRFPTAGLGSETTGVVLVPETGRAYELDFGGRTQNKAKGKELEGQQMKVEGSVAITKSADAGERHILKVEKISPLK